MKTNKTPTRGGNAATANANTPASVQTNGSTVGNTDASPTTPKPRKSKGKARKAPPKANTATPPRAKANPEPYRRFLKTLPVDVRATKSQLGWIKEASLYLRCTPGDLIIAAALVFFDRAGKGSTETGHTMINALNNFIFSGKDPRLCPTDIFMVDMGEHNTMEAARAASDRLLHRLGLTTDSEHIGPIGAGKDGGMSRS